MDPWNALCIVSSFSPNAPKKQIKRISALAFLVTSLLFTGAIAQVNKTYSAIFDFVGRPAELDDGQVRTIEESFGSVYNELEDFFLMFNTPPFVRQVTTVDALQVGAGFLQDPFSTQSFSVVFQVTFECETSCESDILFSNATGTNGVPSFYTIDPFGPTSEFFSYHYNLRLSSDPSLTAIDGTDGEARPLTVYNCSDEVNSFETDIIIDFVGDPDLASDEELMALVGAIQDTYNSLNSFLNTETCDLLFREITSVEIDLDAIRNRRRQLQFGGVSGGRFNYTIVQYYSSIAHIRGNCRKCGKDAALLTNDASRRLELAADKNAQSLVPDGVFSRQMALTGDTIEDCTCSATADEFRPPSRQEFATALGNAVEVLRSQGEIDFITRVEEITEVNPVNCSAEVTVQTVNVQVNMTGNPGNASTLDERALEESFARAYNEIAEDSCDPFFRTVVDASLLGVDILEDDTFNLGQRTRHLMRPRLNFTIPFAAFFQIELQCRGCGPGTPIFGNDAARRLDAVVGRRMQQQDTCYCSTGAVNEEAPSATDFSAAYELVIKEEYSVVSVAAVDGAAVFERSPTTAPAPTLPPMITGSPVAPTPSPTNIFEVDLSRWFEESVPLEQCDSGYKLADANWTVASDNLSVIQSVNAVPSVYCSDFMIAGSSMRGKIVAEGVDDDFIGFAFGVQPGDFNNSEASYFLLDWKKGTQGGWSRGLWLSRVSGTPCCREYWTHQNAGCSAESSSVTPLVRATTLGRAPWITLEEYEFRFEFNENSLRVFVNGNLEISFAGSIAGDGRLCFYNFSQDKVRYSGFTVEAGPTQPPVTPPPLGP